MVFATEVSVKARELFPFLDSHKCVHGIEVADLNIGSIFIIVVISTGKAVRLIVVFISRCCGNAQRADKFIVYKVNAQAGIDKGDAFFYEIQPM